LRLGAAIVAACLLRSLPASAQALTPPAGVGAVTLGSQVVFNTGHRLTDGTLIKGGQSTDVSIFAEVEYGFTNRLAVSMSLVYVFAKYTDQNPPPPFFPYLQVDSCHCWNSALQDFGFSALYRFGDDPWAVTPVVRFVVPSHDYDTRGEAVVGRNLFEAQVGLATALRLASVLPKATLQAGYVYSFVEEAAGVSHDRSNGYVTFGYAVTRRLYLLADARWQVTYGGLRFGSPTGDPFFPPGEINTPDLVAEHDRLLRDNYWRVGGGLSYSMGDFDAFAAVSKYVSGTDTHDGWAYTVGLTYYFSGVFRR
jgi:hypothetical protein